MSNTFTLHVAIDPDDLVHIHNFENTATQLFPSMESAMGQSLDEVEYQAQTWMSDHFINPTGVLENAFEKHPYGPFSAELWNDLPYAQRTNYGFSGMTDILGRYFPYWPGIAWAENAVANAYPGVELIWQVEMDHAMGRF